MPVYGIMKLARDEWFKQHTLRTNYVMFVAMLAIAVVAVPLAVFFNELFLAALIGGISVVGIIVYIALLNNEKWCEKALSQPDVIPDKNRIKRKLRNYQIRYFGFCAILFAVCYLTGQPLGAAWFFIIVGCFGVATSIVTHFIERNEKMDDAME